MTKRVVKLPDIPGAGEELEDYVAALFQASGHFVEKQLVESDPADLLELDIVSTDYTHEEVVRQLIEVKGGGWGYTDLFKLVGLMQYLKIDRGAFFVTKWDKRESAPSRMDPLGLNVVCFNDFKAAPEHFSQKGFGTFVEPDLIELWQHSYGVERRFIKLLHQRARKNEEEGAKAAKIYHRQINNGTFFARAPEESLAMLYEAYSEHPKLTRGYAHELDGGAFDPQSMNPHSGSYTAMLGGKFPELQACSYLEHRARLSILKSAVDYALAHPDGAPELGMSEDGKAWFFEGLTYHALPATFHSGMAWLREQPSFRRYATFWQQLLWGWGGFYLDDREQEEFEWMSKYSGIPDDEIPVALEAFDRFFPIPGGWFVTAGRTDVRMVKMVPWIFQGIGAHHRRVQYELSDLSELKPDAPYTVSDLAKRINCAVDFLLDQ